MGEKDLDSPILLVEGDPHEEARAVRAYGKTGHKNRMLVARTVEHAIMLLRACTKGLRFGLVLADLRVPLHGARELVRRIRGDRALRDVPVVVLGTPCDSEPELRTAAENADTFMRKPDDEREYARLLDQMVRLFLWRRKAEEASRSARS